MPTWVPHGAEMGQMGPGGTWAAHGETIWVPYGMEMGQLGHIRWASDGQSIWDPYGYFMWVPYGTVPHGNHKPMCECLVELIYFIHIFIPGP